MSTAPIYDQELIGYVFAPLTGEHRDTADRRLRAIWSMTVDRLGLTDGGDPPTMAPRPPQGRVAARFRSSGTLPQAFWDNTGDVAIMSVAFRPADIASHSGSGWIELYDTWRALLTAGRSENHGNGLLGTATILAASATHGDGDLADDSVSTAVLAALPTALSVAALRPVVTREGIVIAPLTTSEPDAGRLLVVYAPPGHDEQMGALAWAGPRAPLSRYLRHAAKLDYHRAVAGRDQASLHEQRLGVRKRLAELEPLITVDSAMDAASLENAYRRLRLLQAGTSGLVDSLIQARTMRRTVAIAAANLATAAKLLRAKPTNQSPSEIADLISADAAMARDLDIDLDDHIDYLDASRQRADYFAEIFKQELAARAENLDALARRRQERFTLYQTAIIGVIVMVLTSVQSLEYKVPLPGRVQPAVIAGLGALALLLSAIAVRIAVDDPSGHGRRTITAHLASAAAAGVGACAGWAISALLMSPPDPDQPAVTVAAAIGGAVAGYVTTQWVDRRRGTHMSSP